MEHVLMVVLPCSPILASYTGFIWIRCVITKTLPLLVDSCRLLVAWRKVGDQFFLAALCHPLQPLEAAPKMQGLRVHWSTSSHFALLPLYSLSATE